MIKQASLLLCLSMALLSSGCATSGGKGDILPGAQLGQAKVIVLDLPYTVSTVKKELWEQAMVGFGLESAVRTPVEEDVVGCGVFDVVFPTILHDRHAPSVFGRPPPPDPGHRPLRWGPRFIPPGHRPAPRLILRDYDSGTARDAPPMTLHLGVRFVSSHSLW